MNRENCWKLLEEADQLTYQAEGKNATSDVFWHFTLSLWVTARCLENTNFLKRELLAVLIEPQLTEFLLQFSIVKIHVLKKALWNGSVGGHYLDWERKTMVQTWSQTCEWSTELSILWALTTETHPAIVQKNDMQPLLCWPTTYRHMH